MRKARCANTGLSHKPTPSMKQVHTAATVLFDGKRNIVPVHQSLIRGAVLRRVKRYGANLRRLWRDSEGNIFVEGGLIRGSNGKSFTFIGQ